jgi:hypothetical protein
LAEQLLSQTPGKGNPRGLLFYDIAKTANNPWPGKARQ